MPQRPLSDQWVPRDFPVLVELTRRFDQGARIVKLSEVANTIGMESGQVELAANALQRVGLVELMASGLGAGPWAVKNVSARAYTLTGLHPDGDDIVERLVAVLEQAADRETNPEKASRLRQAARNLIGAGGDVGVAILSALAVSGL